LRNRFRPDDLLRTELGGRVVCDDRALLYEEAPQAYKRIDRVVEDLLDRGLVEVIATLRPQLTYKTRGRE
jgi:release factor H-coupled RctB family protein